MTDILDVFVNQPLGVQVATLSLFGAILVAIVNLYIKYIELKFNRRKEIITEKIKYLSSLQEDILNVVYTCDAIAIPVIEERTLEFFKSKQLEIRKINESAISNDSKLYGSLIIDFLISFDFFVRNDLKISYFTVRNLVENMIKMSPWIVARRTLITKLNRIIDSADNNRISIENLLKDRREEALEALKKVPLGGTLEDTGSNIHKALLIINAPIEIEVEDIDIIPIIKSIREEVYDSNRKLIFKQMIFGFMNRRRGQRDRSQ